MKKSLLIIFISIFAFTTNAFAQLPPVAQVIYDSAYAQDSLMVQYAINNGAQIIATADGNSFYIKWFPVGPPPSSAPLIVTLHGSNGYAFHEFYSWHSQAQLHGCGIIALQWYRTSTANPTYFEDTTLYSYLDEALTAINYPSGKALLHGFSRGSARSYAMVFLDMQSGNNYFCTTMSNAGGLDTIYPLYYDIHNGVYGNNVFAGKHWNLFCGGQDPNPNQSGCPAMNFTQGWLQSQGATVDIYIQDPALGHNGFQLQSSFAYKDSILNNYISCFNGTMSVSEQPSNSEISFFPNPFSDETMLKTKSNLNHATLTLFNSFGQKIRTTENISGQEIVFRRESLPAGIYFLQIFQEGTVIRSQKLIIAD